MLSYLKQSIRSPFTRMFMVIFLLNLDFTLLRAVRNTLAMDLGKGAYTIPLFEFFGALPGALLMTWGLGKMMSRLSPPAVFLTILGGFVLFFLSFALGVYPFFLSVNIAQAWPGYMLSMTFYVMAELWKPALITILFWGLVNQYMPLLEAKRRYAHLMLGASLGSMAAGPVITFATSKFLWRCFPLANTDWVHSLIFMMGFLLVTSGMSALFYLQLWKHVKSEKKSFQEDKITHQVKENSHFCWKTPCLRTLAWIVIADYIAYSLGEVIFLDILKQKFPEACGYCSYMGRLSFWNGALTIVSALFVAPFLLQHYKWTVAALATPLCLLITEGGFFTLLRGNEMSWFGSKKELWLNMAVFLGSFQYCVCRAAKYTLFDPAKEIAFISFSSEERQRGKLMIDGICARFGRGMASVMSMSLIAMCGGVLASSLLAGILAMGVCISWVKSTLYLGKTLKREENARGV